MRIKFNIQHSVFITLLAATPLIAAPYTDYGNGTVLDSATNLVWQKCSMGLNNDSTCTEDGTGPSNNTVIWTAALTYCNTLPLGGKTWRLPNINELSSLVDTTIMPAPASINNTIFPATVAGIYWSSSTYVPNTTDVWYVYFVDGNVFSILKSTTTAYVRCVATGP